MVYPVASGAPQQIPAANTFQPGGTESLRRPEQEERIDSTRPSGTQAARSQDSEGRNNSRLQTAANDRSQDSGAVSASTSRGTSLDISV